ncbi:hypothetical protein EAE89_18455 [Photorhabdus heterorhabditis]|nr:hypothetical protein [Photorhabdus heterorhabditis]
MFLHKYIYFIEFVNADIIRGYLFVWHTYYAFIPVISQVAILLVAFTYPSHIVIYASWGCVHLPPRCNLKSIGYIAINQRNE